MIERWEIISVPTASDPRRHALLLKADMTEVQSIIGRFGAACGRPQRTRSRPEYNFSLYLHGMTPGGLDQLRSFLQSAGAPGAETVPAEAVAVAPAPLPEIVPNGIHREPEAPAQTPPLAATTVPNALPEPPAVEVPAQRPSPATPPPVELAPVIKAPASAPAPAPVSEPTPVPRTEKEMWGVSVGFDPAYTFDSLIIGSFNRFAHAASMAVVSNPGTMYNPLFLYGTPGSGKSHLLTAISKSIQDANPKEPVLLTTGPRLSRAIRLAVAAGKGAELERYIKGRKALMIDDVHLMAVSEQIQPMLVSIFDHFFKSSKHVGLTSVYPPRALGALEDALKFQISSGWSVEVKMPPADAQQTMLQRGLGRIGTRSEPEDEKRILEFVGENYSEIGLWLRRLKAFSDLRLKSRQSNVLVDMLPVLFAPLAEGGQALSAEQARALSAQLPPAADGGPGAKRLAVFFPASKEDHAKYMLQHLQSAAQRNGASLRIVQAAFESYDPDQLFGVPFALANICDRSGAEAALLLGAPAGTGLAPRENEFAHALGHILSGFDAPLGWIPYTRVHDPIAYFRVVLDMPSVWGGSA